MKTTLQLALLSLLTALLSSGVAAQERPSQDGFLSTFHSGAKASYSSPKGEAYRVYHLEFENAEKARTAVLDQVTVFNQSGRFVDIFAPPSAEVLKTLAGTPGLVWMDYNRTVRAPLPPTDAKETKATRSASENVVRNGYDGLDGRGVNLALLDSGFDIRHPDFLLKDSAGQLHSRFAFVWDTTETRTELGDRAPVSYPDGRSVGVLYTREHLNRYIRTPKDKRPQIVWDGAGHGTACASIAAGSGAASQGKQYAGVAPRANLIGVRLGDKAQNTWLVTAVLSWLDKLSGSTPLVVTSSWGGHRSGHDGSLLIERQIDERFHADRKGRVVLFSAGNEGQEALHSNLDFAGEDKAATLSLPQVGPKDEVEVTLYFDSKEPSIRTEPKIDGNVYIHGLTDQWVVKFDVKPDVRTIKIFSGKGLTGHADAYISGKIGDKPALFDQGVASFQELVNNPGNAENVLTIGSYDFNPQFDHKGQMINLGVGKESVPMSVGDLSAYSSRGYTRLGRLKPDLTAPGQWWTAAAPLEESDVFRDSTGLYQLFNGTSAATPYVAGVMALCMEKRPELTLNEIRNLLTNHLREDLFTGPLPNPDWGRGKLNMAAISRIIESL